LFKIVTSINSSAGQIGGTPPDFIRRDAVLLRQLAQEMVGLVLEGAHVLGAHVE